MKSKFFASSNDIINTHTRTVHSTARTHNEAVIEAAILNFEYVRDLWRAAKQQREARANNDATTGCKINHQHFPSCDQPI